MTTFTRFDNLVFSRDDQHLHIYATSLYLDSSSYTFGIATGGVSDGTLPTNSVTLTGNGTADGETRIVFGGRRAPPQTSRGYCQDASKPPTTTAITTASATRAATATKRSCSTCAASRRIRRGQSKGCRRPRSTGTRSRITRRTWRSTTLGNGRSDLRPRPDRHRGVLCRDTPCGRDDRRDAPLEHGRNQALPVRGVGVGENVPADRQRVVAGGGSSGGWAGAAGNPFDCACTIVSPLAIDTTQPVLGRNHDGAGDPEDLDDEADDARPADGVAVP